MTSGREGGCRDQSALRSASREAQCLFDGPGMAAPPSRHAERASGWCGEGPRVRFWHQVRCGRKLGRGSSSGSGVALFTLLPSSTGMPSCPSLHPCCAASTRTEPSCPPRATRPARPRTWRRSASMVGRASARRSTSLLLRCCSGRCAGCTGRCTAACLRLFGMRSCWPRLPPALPLYLSLSLSLERGRPCSLCVCLPIPQMLTGEVPWRELASPMQVIFSVGVMQQVRTSRGAGAAGTLLLAFLTVASSFQINQQPDSCVPESSLPMPLSHTLQRLPIPEGCPAFLRQLIEECWAECPGARPPFPAIRQRLREERARAAADAAALQARCVAAQSTTSEADALSATGFSSPGPATRSGTSSSSARVVANKGGLSGGDGGSSSSEGGGDTSNAASGRAGLPPG